MSLEEKPKESKDNPQIHLLAAKCCSQIQEIWNNSQDENEEKEIPILLNCIRFFAHYIKYLPECNNDVLKMCRFYMFLFKKESVPLDLTVINRLVGICTTMMIRRKEDEVIRSTCNVLRDILEIIPAEVLKSIVLKYSKTLSFIYQKIYLVQTYYTQLRILEIFIYITKDLKELRNEMITKNQLMVKANQEVLTAVFQALDLINTDDLIITSRKFLKFFNNNLFPKTCILSIEGRVINLNGQPVKQQKSMLINFNGHNLTVSFFVPKMYFGKKNDSTQDGETQKSRKDDELIFIELECNSINAVKKVHKEKHYIDVNIEVQEVKTYNRRKHPESLDSIKSISLRLVDDEYVVNRFMDVFYEKYKTNEKMMNDNVSVIDKESVMTFQTSVSMINDLNINLKELNTQHTQTQNVEAAEKPREIQPKVETAPNVIVKNESTGKVKKEINVDVKPSESNLKTRPTRQRNKVNYKADIYDEDNIDNVSELDAVTSYREFKSQQKKKSPSTKTKKKNNDEDYILQPVEIITRTTTTRRSKTTKINPKVMRKTKTAHFETDEEQENQTVKSRRGRKPKAIKNENEDTKDQETNIKKITKRKAEEMEQPKQQLNDFDAVKNILPDIKKTLIENIFNNINENAENNPKRVTESKVDVKPVVKNNQLNTSDVDNFLDISQDYVEPKKAPVQKEKHVPKKQKIADDSFASEISLLNVSDVKPLNQLMVVKPKKSEIAEKPVQTETNKRKISTDDVFNVPEKNKKSKVEEWLQSTSDSFDLFESDQNESMTGEKNKIIAQSELPKTVNKEAPADMELDDAGSDYSNGIYANDEHQHYSSSSQESVDLDVKKPKEQENIGTIEKYDSQILTENYESSSNLKLDPMRLFQFRADDIAGKLVSRKKKLDENEMQVVSKYNQSILLYGEKCMEQIAKTKTQFKHMAQLYLKYETAKSKLLDEVHEQEKLISNFMRTIGKRREAQEMYQQLKKKELMTIKKDALRKNEEIMQDVWREYVDTVQANFNNSIKKTYEI